MTFFFQRRLSTFLKREGKAVFKKIGVFIQVCLKQNSLSCEKQQNKTERRNLFCIHSEREEQRMKRGSLCWLSMAASEQDSLATI